jgi:hypothetical protein
MHPESDAALAGPHLRLAAAQCATGRPPPARSRVPSYAEASARRDVRMQRWLVAPLRARVLALLRWDRRLRAIAWIRAGKTPLYVLAGFGLSTAMAERPSAVRSWHSFVESSDLALLDGLLADDVVFRSPAVFAPQQGKAVTTRYLSAAMVVLGPSLRYIGEWHDGSGAVLEFEAELDGVYLQGVDMLRWNDEDKLASFTVMVRPLRGLEKLIELMGHQLESLQD